MPIETYTHLLLEGKDVWNKGRESQNFQPYFSFEDFYEKFREAGKLDHNGRVSLSGYNLADAIFHGTNLSQVDFLDADLSGAQFRGARFVGTNFSNADLTDAEFGIGYLGDANFSNAILKNTDMVGPNLSGADLGWSRFWRAKLFSDSERSAKRSSPKVHRIKNVAELIEICFKIKARYDGLGIYFRGERDRGWCLRPSVMRPSEDCTFKLRAKEGEMLRGLIARRPEDFRGMDSALEQMVVAQHNGLKTRLLDVSRNPCVALFNACDPRDAAGYMHKNDMSGRIHVFAFPKYLIKSFDSDTVSIIANFAKLDRGYQNLLLGKNGNDSRSEDPDVQIQYLYEEAMRRLYHYIRQEKPQFEKIMNPRDLLRVFVVEPKQSFERIRAQEGAFIISAFHDRFEREQIQDKVENIPVYEYETIIVPSRRKERILKELNLLSFNREALYPSLGEVADRITQLYQ